MASKDTKVKGKRTVADCGGIKFVSQRPKNIEKDKTSKKK